MGGACGTNRGKMDIHMLVVGKTEGKRPLERQRRRWILERKDEKLWT
jgi:hypothetical protein